MNNPSLLLCFAIALFSAVFFFKSTDQTAKAPQPVLNGWERKSQLETPDRMTELASAAVSISNWPPVDGKAFPSVQLFDHLGREFSLSGLEDRPTLIEYVAMSCAGCQAFAGGNKHGAFGGFATQANLDSIDEYFKQYTGHELHSSDINFVQLIVYNLDLKTPSTEDLAKWRKHFELDQSNSYVVHGGHALANKASFNMIPGFQLLDRNQKVLFDSTGHQPKHDLYRELLPAMKKMLERN